MTYTTVKPEGHNGVDVTRAMDIDEPILHTSVPVPDQYRTTTDPAAYDGTGDAEGPPVTYGGDTRMGDLDGDGRPEFVVFRCSERGTEYPIKPTYVAAFDAAGDPLWEHGDGGVQPIRPGPVTVYDIDGDGNDEVLCFFLDPDRPAGHFSDVVVQVRDGGTGEVRRESRPDAFDDITSPWAHQRLIVANLRGTDRPRDFVVKLAGHQVVAFDDRLEVLWHRTVPETEVGPGQCYIAAAGDVDGDGADEVNVNRVLFDEDGSERWRNERPPKVVDSTAVAEWDEGRVRAISSGGHVFDAAGNVLVDLGGEEAVPHGQEVRVANYVDDRDGNEMLLRYDGHTTDVMLVGQSPDGYEILADFDLNPVTPVKNNQNTGLTTVYWHGADSEALACNSQVLWAPDGSESVEFPDLPTPVGPKTIRHQAWYHCIPADLTGDGRDEVVLYNPWDTRVYIYTPGPADAPLDGFEPTERQYNVRLMN